MDFAHLPPELVARLERLGVEPADVAEQFILGSGPGGQKINKTASCVQLHHAPSGIEIRCQETRSRARNRILAAEELCERLEKQQESASQERKRRRAVQRWKHRKPSKVQTKRRLEEKRRRSDVKSKRRGPGRDD